MTTTSDTLTVLKFLAKGRNIDYVAQATGMSTALVLSLGEAHGWPDTVKLGWAVDQLGAEAVDRIPVRAPDPPRPVAKTPQPVAPIPASLSTPAVRNGSTSTPPPGPSIEDLVRACRRSESKRTQALGPKLTELEQKITAALRAERDSAEAKAKQAEEFTAKKAHVDRLKKQLADAQAALRQLKPSGVTEAALQFACEECGDLFSTSQGRGMHRRRSHGQTWSTKPPGAPSE